MVLSEGRVSGYASEEQAKRMVKLRQAVRINSRQIRLLNVIERWSEGAGEHPCRTRVSRGGALAGMGRSQLYTTTNERAIVNGFKTIYPEDRSYFVSAVLDNLKQ